MGGRGGRVFRRLLSGESCAITRVRGGVLMSV